MDWIDVFTRPVYMDMIIQALTYCQQQKGLEIYAYCLMTNHIHLLVSANEPAKLPDIGRDFKKYTNKQIIKMIQVENESRRDWMIYRFEFHARYNNRIKDYKVWQDGYHAIECGTYEILQQNLNYIHQNPVRAQIVAQAHYYLYSSAVNYAGLIGLLNVSFLDIGFTGV